MEKLVSSSVLESKKPLLEIVVVNFENFLILSAKQDISPYVDFLKRIKDESEKYFNPEKIRKKLQIYYHKN